MRIKLCSFIYVLSMASFTLGAELNSCDKNHVPHKACKTFNSRKYFSDTIYF